MAPRLKKTPPDLEAQLAGVLEQDGVTMSSSEGVRRRAKRIRKRTAPAPTTPSIFFQDDERPVAQDSVAAMDLATVDLLVKAVEGAKERAVKVRAAERPRSAFVLSLRSLTLKDAPRAADERLSVHHALGADHRLESNSREAAVYGTLTRDLTVDAYDPHAFAEQFTPSDFFEAHRGVYGRVRRVGSFLAVIVSDLVGLLQRVERVERRVADEVQDTLTIIEVPRLSFARSLAGFVALLLVVTLPANAVALYRSATESRDAAEGAGNAGIQDLLAAKDAGSLPSSVDALKRASSRFREADAVLAESSALAVGIASVLPEKYRAARALLEVGDKSSEAGRLLAVAFEKVFKDPSRRLDERLDVLATYARGALPLLADAGKAAATIDPKTIPEDKRDAFIALTSRLDSGTKSVREFAGMAELLSALSGKERSRTYLLVFQNNTELRPTGGFMGSVAEITMDRGAIKKIFVPPGGTYDLKGQLLAHVISPQPLHLINAHWQFQDANWFPDFPTSADKIRWFWSKSGQPTLDGVIALNASFVERLLDVTGPIEMPAYGKVIDRSNFLLETQKAVEVEYDRDANTPKKFVGDLSDAMLARMKTFGSDDWMKVAALLSEGLQMKEIQIALSDADEQALADRYGWSGRMKDTNGDSLAIIDANIAGQKTDGVVDEAVKLVAEIQPDGSIVDTVTLSRTHRGSKGELFRGVRNVAYIRAYVPKGSQLLDASGFDAPPPTLFKKPDDDYVPDPDVAKLEDAAIPGPDGVAVGDEGSRTVFGGWAQLDPGQTQKITYRYRLPFTVTDIHDKLEASPEDEAGARAAYLLLLTSQSGKTSRTFDASVTVPPAWQVTWKRGTDANAASVSASGAWDRDRVVAALLSPAQPN